MSDYKPSENDGLKKDGTPDKRMQGDHGFAQDKDRASELGSKSGGGGNQPEEVYKPSEHDGLKKDGTPDKRMSSEHGFGSNVERAKEEGAKGGKSS